MSTPVWDLPLRIFHWLLVVAIAAAIVTGKMGGPLLDWHARCGALVMGLLIFRLAWGFVGSYHARFASFVPTLQRLRDYCRGSWRGLGHNPLGALSVLALLATLTLQVATGLFATDDSDFSGPLASQLPHAASQSFTAWHHGAFNLLALLMSLHLGAIVFHARVRNTNLVMPMLTGNKPAGVPGDLGSDIGPPVSAWRALLAAVLSSVLVAGTFNLPEVRRAEVVQKAAPAADW